MDEQRSSGPLKAWVEPEIVEMSAQESESGKTGKSDAAAGASYHHAS